MLRLWKEAKEMRDREMRGREVRCTHVIET